MIEQIVTQVLTVMSNPGEVGAAIKGIPVGISNRHIHLSAYHVEILFGKGHTLTPKKDLKQVGQYAAEETVMFVGPKGVLQRVRVLGPVRKITQVEISSTDGFSLGILPPLRDSGQIDGSAGLVVVGTAGAITLKEGVICAARHIHMSNEDAQRFGVSDGDRVTAETDGPRGCVFKNVLVRANSTCRLEFHIDTDEANAVGLKNGDQIRLPQCEVV